MPWPTGRMPSETSAAALRRVNARSASVKMGAVADHQRHAPIRQHDGHRGEHGLIDLSRRRDPGTDSPENSSDDYTRFVTVLNTTPPRPMRAD